MKRKGIEGVNETNLIRDRKEALFDSQSNKSFSLVKADINSDSRTTVCKRMTPRGLQFGDEIVQGNFWTILESLYNDGLCLIDLAFIWIILAFLLPSLMDISELVHCDAVVSDSRPFQCTFHNCGKAFGELSNK